MPLTAFEIGLISVFSFCFIIQLLFYWIVLAKPYYYMKHIDNKDLQISSSSPPVSIVLLMENSNYDLFRFLPDIFEQEYPEFEVIIVTDGISMEDENELIRFKNRYSNLYTTHVPEDTKNISRKKLALSLGIKAAKYDKILFTETDCRIRSKNWIFLMTRHFSDKKSIVLGFSAIENTNNLSQKFIALDYFFSNLQMISLALFNRPYTGNGRNMAYSKEHFIEQKGFIKYRSLQQGADDLFINEIATKENTSVELSPESVTLSEVNDLHEWKQQKLDRTTTERFYKRGPVAFWRLETFFRIGFFVAFISCLICGFPYKSLSNFLLPGIALFCFLVRLSSQIYIINKTVEYLQLEKFYFTIILIDIFQPFINLYFYIYRALKEKENYIYFYEK